MATSIIPRTSGIYKITCTANGRFYIGSTDNLRRRWSVHRRELRGQYHHSIHLQRAYNKYGEASLVFEIIELVMPWALMDREDYWIGKLKPFGDVGFNLSLRANAPMQGRKHSPEAKAKIGAAAKGNLNRAGKKQSKEEIELRSIKLRGKTRSKEICEKLRLINTGKHHSPETKAKISAIKKGQKPSALATKRSAEARQKTYIVTNPEGVEFQITNLRNFCRENGLDSGSMCHVSKGNYKHHRGWKCRPA